MELNWYWPANGQLTSITLAVEFALTGKFSLLLFTLPKLKILTFLIYCSMKAFCVVGEVLTSQSINTFQLLSHRVNSVSTLTVIEVRRLSFHWLITC